MAKILIVDDSSLGRKLLKRILLKLNHEIVVEAENGEMGISEYKKLKPDIVTMDVDMPGMNGLEASREILKDHPEANIVIISAHEKNDLMDEMCKYGLKHCIIKPVTEENVRITFQQALETKTDKEKKDLKAVEEVGDKEQGTKVSVSHHSVINAFTAMQASNDGKLVSLEIDKETPLNNFQEEDPIVLRYESDGSDMLTLCEISNIDSVNRIVNAEIISSHLMQDDMYQNLPASSYADIRIISTRKRFPAIIKNFMVNELIFTSAADIENLEKISFDIFTKNKLIPIEGKINSKLTKRKNFEYTVNLEFDDYNIKKSYINYLQDLANTTASR